MLSIDWRAPASYSHTRDVPVSGLAWEYLRRNDDYRHDFRNLTENETAAADQVEAFVQRWGLRFPH